MHYNSIIFKVACDKCHFLRMPTIDFIVTEEKLTGLSKSKLIELCNNFADLVCESCGSQGQTWTVFKIELQGEEKVTRQAILQLRATGTKLKAWIEDENGDDGYTQAEMYEVYREIRERLDIEREKSPHNKVFSEQEGTAIIIVDFIKDYPFTDISLFKLNNMSYSKLEEIVDYLESNW